jgi:hypothetical protein
VRRLAGDERTRTSSVVSLAKPDAVPPTRDVIACAAPSVHVAEIVEVSFVRPHVA